MLTAGVLAILADACEALDAGQRDRCRTGRVLSRESRQKRADLGALNDALVAYDEALRVLIGHQRATSAATFWADQLDRQWRAA